MGMFEDVYHWQLHDDIECPDGGDGNSQFNFLFTVLGFVGGDASHQSSTRDVLGQPRWKGKYSFLSKNIYKVHILF